MQTIADSFIVMPGGLGTLEEAIETWNAIKIGEINKPMAFFNLEAYFDHLFKFMACCSENDFLHADHLELPIISDDIPHILSSLRKHISIIASDLKINECSTCAHIPVREHYLVNL